MVVPLHLKVEDLGINGRCGGDEAVVEEAEDPRADPGELGLDARAVAPGGGRVPRRTPRLLLVLDGGDDAPGGPARADDVLVGDGEEVSLLDGELGCGGGGHDLLHELDHLLVALRLLRELGHVDHLLPGAGAGGRHGWGGTGGVWLVRVGEWVGGWVEMGTGSASARAHEERLRFCLALPSLFFKRRGGAEGRPPGRKRNGAESSSSSTPSEERGGGLC